MNVGRVFGSGLALKPNQLGLRGLAAIKDATRPLIQTPAFSEGIRAVKAMAEAHLRDSGFGQRLGEITSEMAQVAARSSVPKRVIDGFRDIIDARRQLAEMIAAGLRTTDRWGRRIA